MLDYSKQIYNPETSSYPDKVKTQLGDKINHPTHYKSDAKCSGCNKNIECIDVTETMSFNLGNALKYIWRSGKKDNLLEDLKKARWYLDREINKEKNK